MCMLRQWCSLSMLHRTCEYMHGVLGWGISMPSGWCILCTHIYFKPRGIKMYSFPYLVQIELTYISIKCGVTDSHDLPGIPCNNVSLSALVITQ